MEKPPYICLNKSKQSHKNRNKMNTPNELYLDIILFKQSLDTALERSYSSLDYMNVLDIFGQEVTVFTRNSEVRVMSDKKNAIWGANNHPGSQANLVDWLINEHTA